MADETVTNPELLKEKEPAAMWFCLDALRRFETKTLAEIKKITLEIALLGKSGIDYSSADKKYSIQTIPAEKFSGLHLLCLMYVGFQKIDPTYDTRLDFKNAYELALKIHKPSA